MRIDFDIGTCVEKLNGSGRLFFLINVSESGETDRVERETFKRVTLCFRDEGGLEQGPQKVILRDGIINLKSRGDRVDVHGMVPMVVIESSTVEGRLSGKEAEERRWYKQFKTSIFIQHDRG